MTTPALTGPITPTAQNPDPGTAEQPGASTALQVRSGVEEPSGVAVQDSETPARDYFREAFNRIRGQTVTAPQAPPSSGRDAREAPQRDGVPDVRVQPSVEDVRRSSTVLPQTREQRSASPATPSGEPKPEIITLTPDELQRRVQSETDRRLARQKREEDERRARDEEVELRRTNPFQYARLMEEREAEAKDLETRNATLQTSLDQQLTHYDRHVLDPIMSMLPAETRTEIITSVHARGVHGVPGRAEIAKEAINTLERRWKDEGAKTARTRLMNDPSFVKEVLARYASQRDEPDTTPSLPVSTGRAPANDHDRMNSFMRSGAASVRGTGR